MAAAGARRQVGRQTGSAPFLSVASLPRLPTLCLVVLTLLQAWASPLLILPRQPPHKHYLMIRKLFSEKLLRPCMHFFCTAGAPCPRK